MNRIKQESYCQEQRPQVTSALWPPCQGLTSHFLWPGASPCRGTNPGREPCTVFKVSCLVSWPGLDRSPQGWTHLLQEQTPPGRALVPSAARVRAFGAVSRRQRLRVLPRSFGSVRRSVWGDTPVSQNTRSSKLQREKERGTFGGSHGGAWAFPQ